MSDPVSPLGGATFDGIVNVTENGPRGMITLRGDLASAALKNAVKATVGLAIPDTQGVHIEGDRGVCWMSPDELLVLVPHSDATAAVSSMTSALEGEHAMVVDVSDARASFALKGDDARVRETLAKLTPADMRSSALPVGTLRRSRIAQVPAAFYFVEDGHAELICFRSVAAYAFGILKHAATSGSEVVFFD